MGLDTENLDNVALYERFGFESLDPQTLDEDVIAYCMVKRTRPQPSSEP